MDTRAWLAIIFGCAAAADDLRRGVISNWISGGALVCGLAYHTVREGPAGLLAASGGALLGFAAFLVFYWMGAMGGGDLKLMAGFGALFGPSATWVAALLSAIAGGALAAASLLFNRRRRAIPYAPAIVLGTWLALLAGR